MTLTIREVKSDDLSWLYIQGECKNTEGFYNIQLRDLVDAINTYIMENSFGSYIKQISQIDYECWNINEEYAEDGMPKYLSDIPEDMWL